jgi:hypothetical protein
VALYTLPDTRSAHRERLKVIFCDLFAADCRFLSALSSKKPTRRKGWILVRYRPRNMGDFVLTCSAYVCIGCCLVTTRGGSGATFQCEHFQSPEISIKRYTTISSTKRMRISGPIRDWSKSSRRLILATEISKTLAHFTLLNPTSEEAIKRLFQTR